MKPLRRRLLPALLVIALPLSVFASIQSPKPNKPATRVGGSKPAVDLTGKWLLVASFTGGGSFRGLLTFKQRGEKLEGHYSSPNLGEIDFSGTITKTSVVFSFSAKEPNRDVTHTYAVTATIQDENTFKGRLKGTAKGPATDMGAEGPFVATRRR